jgi:hypothetical protein
VAQTCWISIVATAVFEILIIQAVKRRKDDWIGHIVPRNWLINTVLEGR